MSVLRIINVGDDAMVRGLYTAAAGMSVQRHKMDNLTNNIVNSETTGYKKDMLITTPFEEVMQKRTNDPDFESYGETEYGKLGYGPYVSEAVTDFSQGNTEHTGAVTDLAIMGNGFFSVETGMGERYTRDGAFTVSADGYLSTQDGHYVLGQNGRIFVGAGDFAVKEDGTVINSTGDADKLKLVTFSDMSILRKEGGNLFYVYGNAAAIPSDNITVLQGARESSNVNVADDMVDMITVYRRYEASQRIVSMTDDSLSLAVNLGSVK